MNVELAKKVRELIRKYPEKHDQNTWCSNESANPLKSCGTTACIAGWVAAVRGYTVAQIESEEVFADKGIYSVARYAQQELKLTDDQEGALFYEFHNTSALAMLDLLIESNGEADSADLREVATEVREKENA